MKKYNGFIAAMLMLISLSGYAQRADSLSLKLMSKLVGTWTVQAETNNGKTVIWPDSAKMRTIKFRLDAHYIWTKGNQKLDSGLYRTNEDLSVVYLESVHDRSHPQEWVVELKGKARLDLIGKKKSQFAGAKYECVKVADGL